MKSWIAPVGRWLTSRYTPYVICGILLLIIVVWLLPRRNQSVVSVENKESWQADSAPPRREVVWQKADELDGFAKENKAGLATPRLTDHGATLYFTRRDAENADIYRARFLDGEWQPAEPVAELNSASDDLGPILSADGRTLYLYSNRPGGRGGFDLYVSHRTDKGWSRPDNLGPTINTPAHEYDPAISPDGNRLVFASNRTVVAEKPATKKAGDKPWSATIRAHPGLSQFDLYQAKWRKKDRSWGQPESLAALNRVQSNEGAPFFSPRGGFLYFASDRPHREGEVPNLDLYRSRLVRGQFSEPENLGPTVNTEAHETEPALSPEGFRLVFSSDRTGEDRLYQSNAIEVVSHDEWDTSHWSLLAPIWWKAVLPTLCFMLLLIVLWYCNDWLLEKVTLARFVMASLGFHVVLLLLLWLTPLPEVITNIVQTLTEDDPVPQEAVVDNAHRPGIEGAPAFEQVAEPSAVASANVTESRQDFAAPTADPDTTPARLKPTLPATKAQTLAPDRVVFQPPVSRAPTPKPKLIRQPPREVTRIARSFDPLVQPVAQAKPQINPLKSTRVTVAREKAASSGSLLPRLPSRKIEQRKPQPATIAPGVPEQAKPDSVIASTPSPLEDRTKSGKISPSTVAKAENEPMVGVVGQESPKGLEAKSAATTVAKNTQTSPNTTPAERPKSAVNLPPAEASAQGFLPKEASNPDDDPTATRSPSAFARLPATGPAISLPAPPDKNPGPVAGTAPEEKPLTKPSVDVARAKTDSPFANVPTKPTRLPTPLARRPLKTGLGGPTGLQSTKEENDPTRTPIAGPLVRAGANPTRVAVANEPVDLKQMFDLRSPEARKVLADAMGGTKTSEEAVERGLVWISQHQNADGSWSLNRFNKNCKHRKCSGHGNVSSDTAGTALALLPFLGAGYTHKKGKYTTQVQKGLDWLVSIQKPNGDLLSKGSTQHMYSHGLAAIALCEAYGMTKDPKLKGPAEKALAFIIKAQNSSGGWRYNPGDGSSDTSVVGWQMMALKSGEMAGLAVPEKTLQGIRRWLARAEGNKPIGGTFGYQNGSPTPAMTAQGLLCLQFLGLPRQSQRLHAGVEYLGKRPPKQNADTSYYWYLATQVMYHVQGEDWKKWNEPLRSILEKTQIKSGPLAGTWDIRDNWERSGGRLYSTSLRLLMLEVYYRHLPLYRNVSPITQ